MGGIEMVVHQWGGTLAGEPLLHPTLWLMANSHRLRFLTEWYIPITQCPINPPRALIFKWVETPSTRCIKKPVSTSIY